MLFVSKKEPLTSETLPDTSLHNVRAQQVQNQKQQQPESSSISDPRSSTFFQPSKACLSKLTKDQFDLHREFLRLGSLLMASNIDLFHNALTELSAKHGLQMSSQATSVCDAIPASQITRRYDKSSGLVASRAFNHKYILPKDKAEKEFYQCMVCKERRTRNSFGLAHTHEQSVRPTIRWYCPICDSFFAVTHRGYHIKNRHSDIVVTAHSDVDNKQESSTVYHPVKRGSSDKSSEEDDCEVVSLIPPEKKQHALSFSPSSISSDSMDLNGSINTDLSVSFDACQELDQQAQVYNNFENGYHFDILPYEENSSGDLFADQNPSPFSF